MVKCEQVINLMLVYYKYTSTKSNEWSIRVTNEHKDIIR